MAVAQEMATPRPIRRIFPGLSVSVPRRLAHVFLRGHLHPPLPFLRDWPDGCPGYSRSIWLVDPPGMHLFVLSPDSGHLTHFYVCSRRIGGGGLLAWEILAVLTVPRQMGPNGQRRPRAGPYQITDYQGPSSIPTWDRGAEKNKVAASPWSHKIGFFLGLDQDTY